MRFTLFSILLLTFTVGQAQPSYVLSPESEIAFMTLGPYQGEIYSAFGHCAIKVSDPKNRVNWAFNYGVFDFDQESFFVNFARGKMIYQLGLSDYERFKNHYIRENRFVIEQTLNLTLEEKQTLFDLLLENYKPENRDYLYNYVYDNCGTKLPEILNRAFPDRITYDYSFVESGVTIRDLMDRYLPYQPWGDWIIDIGLGLQIDKEATPQEYLFLPDYVQKSVEKATIKNDSTTRSLVSKTTWVYTPTPETHKNGLFTPFNFFVLVFFIVGFITNKDFKKERRTKWVDTVLFTFVGILAWWVVFLWFGTDHLSKYNYNLLWAIPLHIPLMYLLGVKSLQPFLKWYTLLIAIGYILLLIFWSAVPQPLHMALVPLILTMILRLFYIHVHLKRTSKKPVI